MSGMFRKKRVFISYASEDSDVARSVAISLRNADVDAIIDANSLESGQEFDHKLRKLIETCDLFVFLISQYSIKAGRYTLSELKFAEMKWRRPDGVVLPVLLDDSAIGDLPPYLKSVTCLKTTGNVVAESVDATLRMLGKQRLVRYPLLLALVVLIAAGVSTWILLDETQKRESLPSPKESTATLDSSAAAVPIANPVIITLPNTLALPLSNHAVTNLGDKQSVFNGGAQFRVNFELKPAAQSASIHYIKLLPENEDNARVLSLYKQAQKQPTGSHYAGAPKVGRYYVRLDGTKMSGLFITDDGSKLQLDKSGNLLATADGARIITLERNRESQYAIDIGLIFEPARLSRVTVLARGVFDGKEFETVSSPLLID